VRPKVLTLAISMANALFSTPRRLHILIRRGFRANETRQTAPMAVPPRPARGANPAFAFCKEVRNKGQRVIFLQSVNGGVKFGHCGGAKVGQFGASALERAALI